MDRAYFHDEIEPLLAQPGVEYIGEINDEQKSEFLGDAVALLFPIDWPEPFGLVMIEAMACGTPVIAWNRGSVPEVLDYGLTGLIVDDMGEAVEAVHAVARFDRGRIRARFEQRLLVGGHGAPLRRAVLARAGARRLAHPPHRLTHRCSSPSPRTDTTGHGSRRSRHVVLQLCPQGRRHLPDRQRLGRRRSARATASSTTTRASSRATA